MASQHIDPNSRLTRFDDTHEDITTMLAEHHVNIRPLEHQTIFKRIGNVFQNLAFGHLHLPLQVMDELESRQEALNNMTSNMYEYESLMSKKVNKNAKYHIGWLCDWLKFKTGGMNTLVNSSLDMFSTLEAERQKRKIVYFNETDENGVRQKRQAIVGGMIIGAAAYGIYNAFHHDEIVDVLQQRQGVLSVQVQNNIKAIAQASLDMTRFNGTMSKVMKEMSRMITREDTTASEAMVLETTFAVEAVLEAIRRKLEAIETIRGGRFALDLVSPQALEEGIKKLEAEALKTGRVISIKSVMDLKLLPASYAWVPETRTFSVIVHVAFSRKSDRMRLYNHLDTPIKIHDKFFSQIGMIEEKYLALSNDMSHYMTLTVEDLQACQKIVDNYYCPSSVVFKKQRKSCLLSLYETKLDEVQKFCPVYLTDDVSKAIKIAPNKYVWVETTPKDLTISCNDRKLTTQQVSGVFEIEINAGCYVFTDTISVSHPKFEPKVDVVDIVLNTPLDTTKWFSREIPQHLYFEAAQELITHVGQKIPLTHVHQLATFKHAMQSVQPKLTWWSWLCSFSPSSLFSHALSYVIVCVVAYVLFKLSTCLCDWYRYRQHAKLGNSGGRYGGERGGEHGVEQENPLVELAEMGHQQQQASAPPVGSPATFKRSLCVAFFNK